MNKDLFQKPEPKCKIKLGTPSPVSFHEVVIPGSIEVDLEMRTATLIEVTEYDKGKYGDAAALEELIRDRFLGLIMQALKKTRNGTLMRGGNPGKYLASLLKDELAAIDIESEIEMIGFALTGNSEKLLKEAMKDAQPFLIGETVDRTDRPYSGFLDQDKYLGKTDYRSDCVPPPLFDPAKSTMPMFAFDPGPMSTSDPAFHDKFCRNCGAKRYQNAKFCTECGSPLG